MLYRTTVRSEVLVAAALALLTCVLVAIACTAGSASAREADRDCGEFASQQAAQEFFVAHGGSASNNFDDLDADHDGIACESNPCPCSTGSPAPTPAPPTPVTPSPPAPEPVGPHREEIAVMVVRDVDGDTVWVRYADGTEAYVRLIGVDTPEDVKPGTPVECGSRQAAGWMEVEAVGKEATLVTDPTQKSFDRYGRRLAYLYVEGRNLDRLQVREGWGRVYVYDNEPFEQVSGFRRAQRSAVREDIGVWRRCDGNFHSAGG
jgi:endonuclease YncB( thermonuclease family)